MSLTIQTAKTIISLNQQMAVAIANSDHDLAARLDVREWELRKDLRVLVFNQMKQDWEGATKSYRTSIEMHRAFAIEQDRRIEAIMREARA